jgi:hypothetical protein
VGTNRKRPVTQNVIANQHGRLSCFTRTDSCDSCLFISINDSTYKRHQEHNEVGQYIPTQAWIIRFEDCPNYFSQILDLCGALEEN